MIDMTNCIVLRTIHLLALLLVITGSGASSNQGDLAVDSPAKVHAEGSWTLVVLPDIQSYVDHTTHYSILTNVMRWIADNRDSLNIALGGTLR